MNVDEGDKRAELLRFGVCMAQFGNGCMCMCEHFILCGSACVVVECRFTLMILKLRFAV